VTDIVIKSVFDIKYYDDNFYILCNKSIYGDFYYFHILREMEIKKSQKSPPKFCCEKCNYNTSNKKDFTKHCLTAKHKMEEDGNEMEKKKSPKYSCDCGKHYKSYSGLWKHTNVCKYILPDHEKIICKDQITPEIILKVIEQNKELTNIILQQNNTINKLCNSNNNTNITNNTQIHNSNKTFNLNFYLNETCKNAMNIDEFVDTIKLSLDDLEYTGRKGYIEGISNIILKHLNRIGEYYRPLHCSDNKREVLYIKSNNTWNKEEDNKPILTNAIKTIANQNIRQISKWKEENPDCINAESKKNNLYLKIIKKSMCGIDKEETNKNMNKILSNIVKEVIIHKNN